MQAMHRLLKYTRFVDEQFQSGKKTHSDQCAHVNQLHLERCRVNIHHVQKPFYIVYSVYIYINICKNKPNVHRSTTATTYGPSIYGFLICRDTHLCIVYIIYI